MNTGMLALFGMGSGELLVVVALTVMSGIMLVGIVAIASYLVVRALSGRHLWGHRNADATSRGTH